MEKQPNLHVKGCGKCYAKERLPMPTDDLLEMMQNVSIH